MTFNTLCDFCIKDGYDSFELRQEQIKQVITKNTPDLISLQEMRTGSQVEYIFKTLDHYELIYKDGFIMSYADAAIAINKNIFKVLDHGFKWLGPNNGGFSFGWKLALPRILVWTKVMHKESKKEFLFIGSHFDNRVENLLGSAKLVNKMIETKNLPVIFAADTNSNTDFKGYKKLVSDQLLNSFDIDSKNKTITSNDPKDLCYLRKGDEFPECRVDHILYSKESIFKPIHWKILTDRFGNKKRFPSDHRPVITRFILND